MSGLSNYVAPNGEHWRCERTDLAAATLTGFKAEDLPRLHRALEGHPRQWLIARRLWGIRVAIPTGGEFEDDLRVHPAESVQRTLGITDRGQWAAELATVAALWMKETTRSDSSPAAAANELAARQKKTREEKFTGRLALDGDPDDADLLEQHGFGDQFLNTREREWFVGRLRELGPLLRLKGSSALAREMILIELSLRRMEAKEVTLTDPVSQSYVSLKKSQAEARTQLSGVTAQLTKMVPVFFSGSGEITLHGCLAEINRVYQREGEGSDAERKALEDQLGVVLTPAKYRVDTMFTPEQEQCLHRMTVHQPGRFAYRASLVVCLMAARTGVFDKAYTLTPGVTEEERAESRKKLQAFLRRVDKGYIGAFLEATKGDGVEPIDLLKTGAGGEYPPIITAEEAGLFPKPGKSEGADL